MSLQTRSSILPVLVNRLCLPSLLFPLLDEEIYLLLKQISLLEIVVVLLLLLLLLLVVDLEVETSRTPLLWMHMSSNTLLRR